MPDIDIYDNANPETVDLPIRKVKRIDNLHHDFFVNLISEKKDIEKELNSIYEDNNPRKTVKNGNAPNVDNKSDDIQKELKAKFDELFGKIDDSDSNDSNNNT